MRLQRETLRGAIAARDDLAEADARTHRARVRYEHAIRRLQASGVTLREIAAALSLSHQRVHQRVHQLLDPSTGKGALRKVSAHTAEPCSFCGAMPARGLVAGSKVSICAR